MQIQSIPTPDSPNNDAFEAIVELYYQVKGYITSSGKWFWVKEPTKRQRGYQDIDVLAVSGRELLIVSVTSGLDDKLRPRRNGSIRNDMLQKLKNHFERIECYLCKVPQYQWLLEKDIKKVVVYHHAYQSAYNLVIPILNRNGIDCLSSSEIMKELIKYLKNDNLKIQNPILRILQLLRDNQYIIDERND